MHFYDISINIHFVASIKENMKVSLSHNLVYETRMRIVNY